MKLMRKLMFIAVLFSAIAPKILSISTGMFQLSVFRAIILIAPILLSLIKIANNTNVKVANKNNRYSVYFMFIWVIYAILSVIWVHDIKMWVRGVFFLVIGLLSIIMFLNSFSSKDDILLSFNLLGLISIAHNAIGWYEVISGNYHFSNPVIAARYLRFQRPVSTFGNVNDFSLFMFFSVFILYICYKNAKKPIVKTIYFISIISTIAIIVSAESRGIVIGLGIASIWFILNTLKRSKSKKVLIFSISLLTIFLALLPFVGNVNFNFLQIDNMYINLTEETGRLNLLKNGLYFLYRTMGFGVGAGNIEYWMMYEGIYPTGQLLNIHNWWAEVLVGFGIIIFTMYLIFYAKLFKSMRKTYRNSLSTLDSSISLSIMCIMLGYSVAGVSPSSNMDSEWLWVFWALAITYQGLINPYQIQSKE